MLALYYKLIVCKRVKLKVYSVFPTFSSGLIYVVDRALTKKKRE